MFEGVSNLAYHREKNIGKVFGEVTIIEFVKMINRSSIYLGKCSCGNIKEFYLGNLKRGKSTSCGCLSSKLKSERSKIHGDTRTRLYRIWTNMKSRCLNANTLSYQTYGKVGITMCDDWANSYETFRDWAHANGYQNHLTIDRIDNAGGYEPNNCRWATSTEQVRNRDYTWNITIDGITKSAKEWCIDFGVNYKTAHTRKSRGWDDVAAVTINAKSTQD